jgi:hypothetical protein
MKHKVREWIRRYLPAELLSITVTLSCAALVFELTGNRITTALAGTWADNISYYGYIIFVDIYRTLRRLQEQGKVYTRQMFIRNLKALALEFGLAEVLDSLLIRPALMYYLPIRTGSLALGILIAKLAADVLFYLPAIIGYELSKKKLRKF